MNYRFAAIAAFALFACGDKNPTTSDPPVASDTARASQNFFPVMDFLKSQIAAVDSLPVGIMKYRSSASTNDSGYIQREEFRKLAAEFIPPALSDSTFKKEFSETSFIDKSTGGATFFYSAINDNTDLKRVDVVTETTDTYDKVKAFILKEFMPKEIIQ